MSSNDNMKDLLERVAQQQAERKREVDRIRSDLRGGDPAQKQVMLLKLTDLMEHKPDFSGTGIIPADSPQRRWLAAVGALLHRLDSIKWGVRFDMSMGQLPLYRAHAINDIQGFVTDAVEAIKLELELDGRSEIGTAYAPGDVYRYFADLKRIVAGATAEVFVIDPYFNGAAFDAYLSETPKEIGVKLLAERYSKDVLAYAEKHAKQFGTKIEIRHSDELHDRLIIIDNDVCWISGGSIKDAGKDATYLIPVLPVIAEAKKKIYGEIWDRATPLAQ